MRNWIFLDKYQEKAKMSVLPLLLNITLEVLSVATRQENKIYTYWKGRNNIVFLFKILCENSQRINKYSEVMIKFHKVTGHKVNTRKSNAFLYTSKEHSEFEIKK